MPTSMEDVLVRDLIQVSKHQQEPSAAGQPPTKHTLGVHRARPSTQHRDAPNPKFPSPALKKPFCSSAATSKPALKHSFASCTLTGTPPGTHRLRSAWAAFWGEPTLPACPARLQPAPSPPAAPAAPGGSDRGGRTGDQSASAAGQRSRAGAAAERRCHPAAAARAAPLAGLAMDPSPDCLRSRHRFELFFPPYNALNCLDGAALPR